MGKKIQSIIQNNNEITTKHGIGERTIEIRFFYDKCSKCSSSIRCHHWRISELHFDEYLFNKV